ncbi:Glycosyl transferase, family 11 [Candidatus Nanopelagicaceae bacterium]
MSVLVLRGGLGNQIFQFAAGLTILEDDFTIWTSAGEPRTTLGVVELANFSLPSTIKLVDGPNNKLTRKLLSWNLVLGLKSEESKKWRFLMMISRLLGDLYFSILIRTTTFLIPGIGVGFFNLKMRNRKSILNGYFQSDFWARNEKTSKILNNLRIKTPSKLLLHWIELIGLANPIVVHVRLGDYRNEAKIGILKPNYFYRALNNPAMHNVSKNVWIFTDEPSSIVVSDYVPSGFKTTVFDDLSLSPAETLELMRYGSAYVISNSTFSWWAAYLSYTRRCPRFMPKPWFKNTKSPLGINPLDWIEISEPF